MPTVKIVDNVKRFYLQKGLGGWNRIYCVVTSIHTLPLRTNSEVKNKPSDSEANSFANLSRDSDEDMMEEDEEDVEESITHKLTSLVDVT